MKKIILIPAFFILANNIAAQNVGIGTPTPTKAKLEIVGAAGTGTTVAAFGTDGAGLSIQKDVVCSTIGFNQYRDQPLLISQGKQFANGYSAIIAQEVNNGKIKFDMYDYGAKDGFTSTGRRALTINNNGNVGIRDEALNDASFFSPKQNNFSGSAVFAGTVYSSYFHFSTTENTYIRGGIANSKVILNDVPGGKVGVGKSAEAITNITSTLSVFGSLKLPGKIVNADYTLTEDDFTILVNMSKDKTKTITINLPTPNATSDGRIYIIKGINMPGINNVNEPTGWIKVTNITEEYYPYNKLYSVYNADGVFTVTEESDTMESFTVQCINNQWRIISKTHEHWFR